MAIATQVAAAGRSCLLVGKSPVLDSPSPFRVLSQVHPVLFRRAHFRDSTTPSWIVSTESNHLVSEQARANVMRSMIAYVTRLHGENAVPAFVLRSIGLIAAA